MQPGTAISCDRTVAGWRLSAAGACVGMFSALSQVVIVRETLATSLGSELTIGLFFAVWFLWVTAGAWLCRIVHRYMPPALRNGTLASAMLLLAAAGVSGIVEWLPLLRTSAGIAAGEYLPVCSLATGLMIVLMPVPLVVGFAFPALCANSAQTGDPSGSRGISRIYQWESAGFFVGGLAATFILSGRRSSPEMAWLASGTAVAGAVALARGRLARVIGVLACVTVLAGVCLQPAWEQDIVNKALSRRLKRLGIEVPATADGAAPVRLAAAADTRYQNLVVTESAGQYALYGDGKVVCTFPDPAQYEIDVHSAMAQQPDARRILVLGGNVFSEIPEFLRHGVERVTLVDLDPGTGRLMAELLPERYGSITRDSRLELIHEDPWRYVVRCTNTFDLVYMNAPPPLSMAMSRFWTMEFFNAVRSCMAVNGVFCTSLRSSERLASHAAPMAASVRLAMMAAFPVVKCTAGDPIRFFAGGREAGITLDRQTLYERAAGKDPGTTFFRPEYFLGADEISPARMQQSIDRMESAVVGPNSTLNPVALFHGLLLWGQVNRSPFERVLAMLSRVRSAVLAGLLFAAGAAMLLVYRQKERLPGVPPGAVGNMALIGTTGFAAIAVEVILLFLMQSIYGYVYSMIGLVVALFMGAMAAGACLGRRIAERSTRITSVALIVTETLIAAVACLTPVWATWAGSSRCSTPCMGESVVFVMMAVLGVSSGVEFPLVLRRSGVLQANPVRNAASAEAADNVGAALGSLVTGVLVVPVYGIVAACILVAGLKLWGTAVAATGLRRP